MANVLVTSAGTRIAYTICKSLAKRGLRVYAGDSLPMPMTAFSRFCAGSFRYASPFTEEERFWENLARFIRQKDIDVLVPVLEETYCIARNRERLDGLARVLLPDFRDILAVHDKGNLAGLARRLGIAVPRSVEATEVQTRPESLGLRYPVLLKPKQGGGGWAMRRFDTATALQEFLYRPEMEASRFLVQEECPGETLCACAIYYRGTFVAGDCYRTVHAYPMPYGQATARESVEGVEALKTLRTLLDHLGWNGVCEADLVQDPAGGPPCLVDVNPRFWGSLAHNIAAGLDYPYYYYRLALDDPSFTPGTGRPGTRTRWLGGDLLRFFAELRRTPDKTAFLKASLRGNGAAIALDDWDIADPLPFAAWAAGQCFNKLSGRRRDALPGIWV